MSKNSNNLFNQDLIDELEELDEQIAEENGFGADEISDEDYGFILDADGNLKSIFMPEEYTEIPEKVYEIFKLFGIEDIEEINARCGHILH